MRERERDLPAPNTNIEAADDVVFFFRESPMLDVWPQVIQPSQSTTLSASLNSCLYNLINETDKNLITS